MKPPDATPRVDLVAPLSLILSGFALFLVLTDLVAIC